MENDRLYIELKKKLCRMIFEDKIKDGDFLPPERKMAEELGISRVTVRKALDLLEEEHIIRRYVGKGTVISLNYGPKAGDLDIITLVAPAHNAFFADFMSSFQTEAEKRNSLVLYKQKSRDQSLESCLLSIYEKDIRNVVLWMQDMEIEEQTLKKLRGLGMNLILFDTPFRNEYADCVCLDNQKAIAELHEYLVRQGCSRIGYIGWDEMHVGNIRAREEYYTELEPRGCVCRVPWKYQNHLEMLPREIIAQFAEKLENCDGIIYSVGDLGICFEKNWSHGSFSHKAAMIDRCSGAEELGITCIGQNFDRMTKKILECLTEQNMENSVWHPAVYYIEGEHHEYGL